MFISFLMLFKSSFQFYLLGTLWLLFNLNSSYGSFLVYSENKSLLCLCFLCSLTGLFIWMTNITFISQKMTNILVWICFLFFVSSNLMMLFVLFEMSLFPILLIIMMFGVQVERTSATSYMMIYTLVCSLPLLLIIWSQSTSSSYFSNLSWIGSILSLLAFLVKTPIYLFHLWLPKAHVESPTFGSVLLASLLLKLGTIGTFRLIWHMKCFNWGLLFWVSIVGMLLMSLICFWQSDLKSLIAYSSVCHMSFVVISILVTTSMSISGSVLMMMFHGTTSSLMFYFVGTLYHILNTRMVYYINSTMKLSMMLSFLILMTLVLNFSVPPTSLFLSESLMVTSLVFYLRISALVVLFYILFVCYYSLYMLVNIFTGTNNYSVSIESMVAPGFIILAFNLPLMNLMVYS